MALELLESPPASHPLPLALPDPGPASPPFTAATPRLSVVIVNYRQWDLTARLVRALASSPSVRRGDAEVVVVDNHSPPHPAMTRLRRWPGVSLRRWGRNRGFGRAANEGCRLSQGEWFLLLNPDVSVEPDFIDRVLGTLNGLPADPSVGVVGFQLRNSDGRRQPSSGPLPTLATTLAGLFQPRARRKYHRTRSARPRRVPWVTGCCLLVRRACFQALGGFDKEFFLYYEDVDLCLRAAALGWSVWHDPRLRVVHHQPLHSRPASSPFRLITRHSLLVYASKHWPRWQLRILTGIVGLEGRVRRWWAWWKGRTESAGHYAALEAIASHVARGQRGRARQLLDRAARTTDLRERENPRDQDNLERDARRGPLAIHHHPES